MLKQKAKNKLSQKELEEKALRRSRTWKEIKRAAAIWGVINLIMSIISVAVALLNK